MKEHYWGGGGFHRVKNLILKLSKKLMKKEN
jgi:hypothetical protein